MKDLYSLIAYLAQQPQDGRFQQWHIQRIGGSANNLLYRATNYEADLAIKFTIRDSRQRAAREYHALLAVQEAGLDIAPKPVWLDESRYTQPVVVQTWLEGVVTADPPQTDAEWEQLIAHYAAIHTVKPEIVQVKLETAVINFHSIPSAWNAIQQQLAAIPPAHQPASLQKLLRHLATHNPGLLTTRRCSPPHPLTCNRRLHSPPHLALCRVDANTLNFLRRPETWASVDWENSGWGDPAFEIVDMMAHPQYATVSQSRWEWVITLYAKMTGDETAVSRIRACYPFMLVWWAVRLARGLYEVPRGFDQRLAERPSNWQADMEMKYEKYVELAEQVIE